MKQTFLFLFFSLTLFAQEFKTDYFVYHQQINKAEEFLYGKNNLDSCFYYYNKTFKEFDFIFAKDLINAAQLAKVNKLPYQTYIEQGFAQGLKPEHLEAFPIFKDVLNQLKKDKNLQEKYVEGRKKYLKRIDFDYLDKIYDLAIFERKYQELDKSECKSKLSSNFQNLVTWIEKEGFPGEKLLGIKDSTIFREIKSMKNDLVSRSRKIIPKSKDYKVIQESDLCQNTIETFLYNLDYCFFKNLNTKFLLKEIRKGNLHPHQIALLNDFAFYNVSYNVSYNGLNSCGGSLPYALFTNFINSTATFNMEQANQSRKIFYMNPYETDYKKKEYEKKYQLNLSSGNFFFR
ncbi:hypothetical protein [Flavobacterium sp. U410]